MEAFLTTERIVRTRITTFYSQPTTGDMMSNAALLKWPTLVVHGLSSVLGSYNYTNTDGRTILYTNDMG